MSDKVQNELRQLANELENSANEGRAGVGVQFVQPLTPDEPIHSPAQDVLNRTRLATELAKAIARFDATESVVIGIHGPWGSGKTSLLNLIQNELECQSDLAPLVFRYNPWGFSDQEQLTSRFFDDLSAFLRLHMSIPSLRNIADAVGEYGELFNPVGQLLAPRASIAVKAGWSLFRRFKPKRYRTAVDLKTEISSALRRSPSKLIIAIDDVDRLNATEIRQVFQLIKLNANFANTVYLVAFSKTSVEAALQPVSPGDPREYLQKIVQVEFNLPLIDEPTLTRLILEEFNATLASFSLETLEETRFGNMFHMGFRESFQTLRDLRRYFNLLRFALVLMKDDTNFVDLAAIQSIALFCPELYSAIGRNQHLFSGVWHSYEREEPRSARPKFDAILKEAPESRQESMATLCRFLFPKMDTVYGNANYGPEFVDSWEKQKRIAAPRYFPFYFQLSVPKTEVSEAEFAAALRTTSSVESFIESLRAFSSTNRFGAFVDRLRHSVKSLSREAASVILQSIFVYGDEVTIEGTGVFGVVSDHLRFASWLLYDILDTLGGDRFELLARSMRGRPATYTVASTAAMCESMVRRGEQGAVQFRERYPDLTPEACLEMCAIAVDSIRQAAQSGSLVSAPRLPFLLYRWRKWANAAEPISWFESVFLQDPRAVLRLIATFIQQVSSFGLGDRVARRHRSVSLKDIREFVDLNRLTTLVQATVDGDLSQAELATKRAFLRAKEKVDAGWSPDSIDTSFPQED